MDSGHWQARRLVCRDSRGCARPRCGNRVRETTYCPLRRMPEVEDRAGASGSTDGRVGKTCGRLPPDDHDGLCPERCCERSNLDRWSEPFLAVKTRGPVGGDNADTEIIIPLIARQTACLCNPHSIEAKTVTSFQSHGPSALLQHSPSNARQKQRVLNQADYQNENAWDDH